MRCCSPNYQIIQCATVDCNNENNKGVIKATQQKKIHTYTCSTTMSAGTFVCLFYPLYVRAFCITLCANLYFIFGGRYLVWGERGFSTKTNP